MGFRPPPGGGSVAGSVDEATRFPLKDKSAGDDVIGGLRCDRCHALYVPDDHRQSTLCRACHYYALLRERYGRDPRRLSL
jgi:hypothetical protein